MKRWHGSAARGAKVVGHPTLAVHQLLEASVAEERPERSLARACTGIRHGAREDEDQRKCNRGHDDSGDELTSGHVGALALSEAE